MVKARSWEAVSRQRQHVRRSPGRARKGGGNRCRVTFQLTFLESQRRRSWPTSSGSQPRLGVDRVKGHHLWAHFAEIEQLSMRRSPDAVRRWNAAVIEARAVAEERAVLLENIFLLDEQASPDLAPSGACPFLGQEAWVSAEGRFDPCCAPDAQRRTLGEFGSLHHRGLLEIWRSDPYRSLVAGYRTRTLCTTCTMRRPVPQ
jgi:hypothetical protein